jgi:hypothetical protein
MRRKVMMMGHAHSPLAQYPRPLKGPFQMTTGEECSEHSPHRGVTIPPKKAKYLSDHHEGNCHGEEDEQGA